MTIIAGVVDGDQVLVGADREGTQWGENRVPITVGKLAVHTVAGRTLVLGNCGNRRVTQELQQRWKPPDLGSHANVAAYPYVVAESLQKHLLGDDQLRQLVTDDKGVLEGRSLMAWGGRLWHLGCDFLVDELARDYWAVGCAADFALGGFAALEGIEMPPQERLVRALEAAVAHDVHIRAPFDIVAA